MRIEEAIWAEQLQTAEWQAWLSGTISSDFLETDWSAETNLEDEFREEDWEYFPLLDLSSGTDFGFAWFDNQLTSFPAIDLSSGTNFRGAWRTNNLISFPAIDLSSGNDFSFAWNNNNLTSFPAIDLSNGNDFSSAWRDNSLTSFPANIFDNLSSPSGSCFASAWEGNSIDAQGMENILVSIDTSGANAPASVPEIEIDTNGDPLTTATQNAITSLKGKGWDVVIDGVSQ